MFYLGEITDKYRKFYYIIQKCCIWINEADFIAAIVANVNDVAHEHLGFLSKSARLVILDLIAWQNVAIV